MKRESERIPSSIETLEDLAAMGGHPLTLEDRTLLKSSDEGPGEGDGERAELITEAAIDGFMMAGMKGWAFSPTELIEVRFGRTLAQNYPEAGPSFLKLATSYWTLETVVQHREVGGPETVADVILSVVESTVASVFFPTPGPYKIDPDIREEKQREVLTRFADDSFDVEDFIRNNPILLRDRGRSPRSGCTPSLAVMVLLASALGALLASKL